jgi:glycosyltransferase involved in cell wall biosynthesis
MRIGVLTHNYPRFPGDFSGTFVESLCAEFARQGQEVTVYAPDDAAFAGGADALRAPVRLCRYRYAWPARLQRLGYMRSMQSDLALRLEAYALSPLLFAAGIAAVLRAARRTRPDVLHAHWLLPNGYIAAVVSRRLGIPLVVSVPGSDAQVAGKNPLFRAMARATFRQAALLTANSADLRDAVVDLGADPARFDLIVYGTDPAALRPDPARGAPLRARWLAQAGLDALGALVVLCVGRMVHKKGFDVLLRALATEPLRGRPVLAVMVGDGDQRRAWEELAAALGVAGRVHWAGTVAKDRIGDYYNAADVLAMPSVTRPADGLNVCVLDAMSCGRAVVASHAAGNPLAVADGETGFLVPEQDPGALAAALARLACDPALRARMGAAARDRIERELGWPPLARRYLEHFERLRADKPVRG